MIVAMQFDPKNLLVTLRNTIRQKLSLPSASVNIFGQVFFVDALTVDPKTSLSISAPDPGNLRGVPTFDNQNKKQLTANPDAVLIIDQPISGERWVGAVGLPTTLNGKPVSTRRCRDLDQAILATTGPQYFAGHTAEHFSILAGQCRDTIWGGDCYNYALLASGHIDIVVEAGLKLHDLAALVPIVEGAGGRMCDWSGEPLTDASDGNVIAIGDPARLDDVIEALSRHSH